MAAAGTGVVTALLKVGLTDLTQHTARLKNATAENAALDAVIPAFDADLKAIATAFSAGTADVATCLAACSVVDQNIFAYLFALAQKKPPMPGVSWNGPTTAALGLGNRPSYTITCNKLCTASCCVYLNDLRPAIYGRGGLSTSYAPWQSAPGVVMGLIELIQKGGGVLKVITVAPPPNKAYGNYSRVGYNLMLTPPPVQAALASTVAELAGGGAITLPNGTVIPAAGGVTGATTGVLSSLGVKSANPTVLLLAVGLVFGAVLLALFGRK
jgi:hypothetical protein